MKITFLNLICFTQFILGAISLNAQSKVTDNIVGKNHKIYSKSLDDERIIQIYTPKNYFDSEKKYPVLFVMDSQEYFLQAIAHQNMLRFQDYTPEFIVVGIKTNRQKRRQLLFSDSQEFTSFIRDELIPYIDTNYRTLKEKIRLYFGWEMAGGFGLELIGENESIFSDFIIASPSHISEKRINSIGYVLNGDSFNVNSIYISMSVEESFIKDEFKTVSMLFEEQKVFGSRATFKVFNDETHYTTPNKTMHNSLLKIFHDYIPIRKFSIKEYDDLGGLKAIRLYYLKRGKRYHLNTNVDKTTVHSLLFFAMKENNFERFELYINSFGYYVNSQITRDFWYNRFAQFFIKNSKQDKAFDLYEIGLKNFPESSLLNFEIGNLYKLQGNLKKAKKYYMKAIFFAKKNNDPESINYEKNLEKLK
jgi:predicted alpha/beta superfamily hydrolase